MYVLPILPDGEKLLAIADSIVNQFIDFHHIATQWCVLCGAKRVPSSANCASFLQEYIPKWKNAFVIFTHFIIDVSEISLNSCSHYTGIPNKLCRCADALFCILRVRTVHVRFQRCTKISQLGRLPRYDLICTILISQTLLVIINSGCNDRRIHAHQLFNNSNSQKTNLADNYATAH